MVNTIEVQERVSRLLSVPDGARTAVDQHTAAVARIVNSPQRLADAEALDLLVSGVAVARVLADRLAIAEKVRDAAQQAASDAIEARRKVEAEAASLRATVRDVARGRALVTGCPTS
jgi:hypothetical protein